MEKVVLKLKAGAEETKLTCSLRDWEPQSTKTRLMQVTKTETAGISGSYGVGQVYSKA